MEKFTWKCAKALLKKKISFVFTTLNCQSTDRIRIRWKISGSGSDQKGPDPAPDPQPWVPGYRTERMYEWATKVGWLIDWLIGLCACLRSASFCVRRVDSSARPLHCSAVFFIWVSCSSAFSSFAEMSFTWDNISEFYQFITIILPPVAESTIEMITYDYSR